MQQAVLHHHLQAAYADNMPLYINNGQKRTPLWCRAWRRPGSVRVACSMRGATNLSPLPNPLRTTYCHFCYKQEYIVDATVTQKKTHVEVHMPLDVLFLSGRSRFGQIADP